MTMYACPKCKGIEACSIQEGSHIHTLEAENSALKGELAETKAYAGILLQENKDKEANQHDSDALRAELACKNSIILEQQKVMEWSDWLLEIERDGDNIRSGRCSDFSGLGGDEEHYYRIRENQKESIAMIYRFAIAQLATARARLSELEGQGVASAENAESMLRGIIGEVISERERQKSVEGWTPEHDDQHSNGELALAACYYAMPEPLFVPSPRMSDISNAIAKATKKGRWILPEHIFAGTGWSINWAKRGSKTSERRLVVAIALLLAEAERRERACLAELEARRG